jgi:hypothetical protein
MHQIAAKNRASNGCTDCGLQFTLKFAPVRSASISCQAQPHRERLATFVRIHLMNAMLEMKKVGTHLPFHECAHILVVFCSYLYNRFWRHVSCPNRTWIGPSALGASEFHLYQIMCNAFNQFKFTRASESQTRGKCQQVSFRQYQRETQCAELMSLISGRVGCSVIAHCLLAMLSLYRRMLT